MLVIISIRFVIGHYNHVHLIGIHDIGALIWQEMLFFPPVSLLLKFIHEIRQTWMLIIISVLFVIGATIMFSSLGYTMLMLWICKKNFSFSIFLIIKAHPWNETNIDTRNNLHSICHGHYNHVLFIRIHDLDALDLQEKLFFPPFSL